MKKITKFIYGAAAISCLMVLPTSCKKSFLDEKQITSLTTADYETTFGLD